jgi:eukaryotic-like serine/threonine-protein kinase
MQESVSSCLDGHTLRALASGLLDAGSRPDAEAHLASCATCRRAVNELVSGLEQVPEHTPESGVSPKTASTETQVATHHGVPPTRADSPAPGTIIGGRYRVERSLGHGGMGSVVAATHIGLEQRVAIKILRLHSPESAARFMREGRTLAQLCSQHIVRVYDSGQLPNGTPYIVMEHLDGVDLGEACTRGPLEIREVVGYVRQACEALQTAHSAGIVHRDLKPSNLFLIHPGGEPQIKVLDFGISKSVVANPKNLPEAGALTLTGTGDILGSPRYMSPEQLHGNPALDQRTDIWSLGVILYELLTGQNPFAQQAFAAIAIAVATEPPIPPRNLRPDLPRSLETIILRCLEKEPDQRFASAAELSNALEPFESDSALEVSAEVPAPATAAAPAPLPVRRRHAWTIAVLAVLIASALLWTQLRSAAPSTNRRTGAPVETRTRSTDAKPTEAPERPPPVQEPTIPPPREPTPAASEPANASPASDPAPPATDRASTPPRRKPTITRRRVAEVQPQSAPALPPPENPPVKRIEGLSATPD